MHLLEMHMAASHHQPSYPLCSAYSICDDAILRPCDVPMFQLSGGVNCTVKG